MTVLATGLRRYCSWLLPTLLLLSACGQQAQSPAAGGPPQVPVDAGLPLAPAGRVIPPLRFLDARDSESRAVTDLDGLRRQGVLRMVFWGSPGQWVPPPQHPLQGLMTQAEYLAEYLGLELQPLAIEKPGQLLPLLRQGRAEMVGELLPPVPVPGTACSAAVAHVRLLLVGRRSEPQPPLSLRQAVERGIWVADEPGWEQLRRRAGELLATGPETIHLARQSDSLRLLARVAGGRVALALVRSDRLQAYQANRQDVQVLFEVDRRRPLCWMVAERVGGLLEAVNAFLYERALTTHRRRHHGGDLDRIREYGALRVAMLNNSVAYFIYRGQEVGFQYELAELLSRRLGLRLEVVVPKRPGDATRMVIAGQADVAFTAPGSLDPGREQLEITRPLHWSDQVLVQPAGEPAVNSLAGLTGRTIYLRRSSQYYPTALALAAVVPWLRIAEVAEDLETEDIIDLVGNGKLPLTIANSVLLGAELTHRSDIQGTLVVSRHHPLVLAVRRGSSKLLKRLERFIKRDCRGKWFAELVKKYFSGRPRMQEVRAESLSATGSISPYDDLAREMGARFAIDWRLILAQMYKESRFNPRAVSWSGARGLMQVMPQTGVELGVSDLFDPRQNLRAGVTYLVRLINSFEPGLSRRQRIRFALAAYNAGIGHVRDARRLAWRLGYDPNRWFGHVERAMRLLEQPAYYRHARYGYCRGSETVQYVSEIQSKYEGYSRLVK